MWQCCRAREFVGPVKDRALPPPIRSSRLNRQRNGRHHGSIECQPNILTYPLEMSTVYFQYQMGLIRTKRMHLGTACPGEDHDLTTCACGLFV